MTEVRVFIEGDFAIEGKNLAVFGEHQWVYLNQSRIFFYENLVELEYYITD